MQRVSTRCRPRRRSSGYPRVIPWHRKGAVTGRSGVIPDGDSVRALSSAHEGVVLLQQLQEFESFESVHECSPACKIAFRSVADQVIRSNLRKASCETIRIRRAAPSSSELSHKDGSIQLLHPRIPESEPCKIVEMVAPSSTAPVEDARDLPVFNMDMPVDQIAVQERGRDRRDMG